MACLLSISFSTPLCTPRIRTQEVRPWRLSLDRLSRLAGARTVPKLLATYNANKGILSVNRIHQHHLVTPSRWLPKIVACPQILGSCTPMMDVISGHEASFTEPEPYQMVLRTLLAKILWSK
ncbi:hypothetical protein CJ030_MR0G003694 [Morella rubra]|uniref:Uncharacterized protein n=1 Tax=Morella rubra TaxID=262757 RepID=A0A6A1UMF1_9ROSI|nr:hypothetical protein CJ030_MR0G003694 [Morella rubra]